MSLTEPTWQLRTVDPNHVRRLQEDRGIHAVVARVLVARGLHHENVVDGFLNPRLSDLLSPAGMAGISRASERIGRAVLEKEHVGIFGDYDVDGISSSALIGDYLIDCKTPVTMRVARREEGYGFGVAQARELVDKGCTVLVLTDCGTSDHAAVQEATNLGADVVAVDHHQLTQDQWPGYALINPQRPDCEYSFKGLTSVGLVFYLVATIRRVLEAQGLDVPDPKQSLDLVALGTIADVAPLEGVNRILVSRGLVQLGNTQRPGLRELLRLCNISGKVPTSEQVGWRLGPRLNAPGRLGDASISLSCLSKGESTQGVESARQCDSLNEKRREIQAGVQDEAIEMARQQVDRGLSFILVAKEEWHPGVIGIVASKLVSMFHRPAAVVSLMGEEGKGSARCVAGLDLVQLLAPCADTLIRFGGHAAAAGFSVRHELVEALHQKLHAQTEPRLNELGEKNIKVDCLLDLARVDYDLCQELHKLGPFGSANPEPIFVANEVWVDRVRLIGEDHLGLELRDGDTIRSAIGFGLASKKPRRGDRVDVAFVPEIDQFRNKVRLRLIDFK